MKTNIPDESVGLLIGQTYRKLVNLLAQAFKEYEITSEQWAVLYRTSEQDGINQKEIALRTAKDQPSTTRILDALIRKGLVEKQMSVTDRRAYLVYLTEKGRALVERTIPVERGVIEGAIRGIDSAQLEMFKQTLLQIAQNVEELTSQKTD